MQALRLTRKRLRFFSDPSRVITKFFASGGEDRKKRIIRRVLALSSEECRNTLQEVLADFCDRHSDFENILLNNYQEITSLITYPEQLSYGQRLLLGAYFTQEYSIESAALFNPSIVPHPEQGDLPEGSVRYILSFRATGEGHVSSLVFRSGVLNRGNHLLLDPVGSLVRTPVVELNPMYDKPTFLLKLEEVSKYNDHSVRIFEQLPNRFLFNELKECIREAQTIVPFSTDAEETIEMIFWIARSNYEVRFQEQSRLSERVIFPVARNESNGIEDARFVRFTDKNNDVVYYATYTAYNGETILPMLLETRDFLKFKMCTLNGKVAKDKGMALFPRKINGRYMMISRQDGENLYIMASDNLHFWNEAQQLQEPQQHWEFVQIGNCGSPLETEAGWLLLTHGVGPLRKYCIGAALLDLSDPSQVIGRLEDPLIMPNEYEREGYVPNVVYTCGAVVHNETLVIPYALSDTASGIATIPLQRLLDKLRSA